jgi:AraC-like DNA-binding protein
MRLTKFCLILIFLQLGFRVFSQSTESEKLLLQANEMVFWNPQEAQKIASHILKQAQNEKEKSQAFYMSALSNYVMGKYDEALTDAFSSKNLDSQDPKTQSENVQLIQVILKDLKLKTNQFNRISTSDYPLLKTQEFYAKGMNSLTKNQIDSLIYYCNQIQNSPRMDYLTAQKSKMLGEIFFVQKKLDSSSFHFQKVQEFAQEIQNPFLEYEARHKLSRNFLAMDRMENFQEQSQKTKELSTITYKIENNAANVAHKLIVSDLDVNLSRAEQRQYQWIWALLSLLGITILLKLILYFRNKSKIKTYTMLANYLQKKEENENQKVVEKVEKEEELEEVQKVKSGQILKESELQILHALEKFEASEKFTNKDMSLGLLAAQLNTNTKYLSEIINRQKNKNFNAYINELRIHYITEKLRNNPPYLNYKVSYLAEECGFSSHSTFTTVFKSIVGVSPVTFLDLIREDLKSPKIELEEHVS